MRMPRNWLRCTGPSGTSFPLTLTLAPGRGNRRRYFGPIQSSRSFSRVADGSPSPQGRGLGCTAVELRTVACLLLLLLLFVLLSNSLGRVRLRVRARARLCRPESDFILNPTAVHPDLLPFRYASSVVGYRCGDALISSGERSGVLLLPHNSTRVPAFGVRPSRAQKRPFVTTLRLSPSASANSLVPVAEDGHSPTLRPSGRQLWGKSS